LATDSRVTYGDLPLMRDEERKIDSLNKKVAITSVGLTGACDKILKEIKASMGVGNHYAFDEIVEKCEDIMWGFFKRNKERIQEEGESEEGWSVQLISSDRMIDIEKTGFSQEEPNYLCEGSGKPYAEFILRQRYSPNLTEQECKELVAYVVLRTSRIDPSVGGPINMVIVDEKGFRRVPRETIEEIVENITELPEEYEVKIQKLVNEIVEQRRWINSLFKNRFKTALLRQNEKAISEIQRGCKNENDFTNRIAALSLLIDDMEIPVMQKETSQKTEGTINQLEAFAKKRLPKLDSECIAILRDIYALRSKKMPIHKDDPKILQVLLKWEYKIPPNWSSLWIKALSKYRDGLAMLRKAIK